VDSVDEASPEFSDGAQSSVVGDSDDEVVAKKAKAPAATGPKKTASEMYQKVGPGLRLVNPQEVLANKHDENSCLNSSISSNVRIRTLARSSF
jgi:hypothetical protein